MPTVDRDSGFIYYESWGDGPVVVLAHGAGGNAAIWWQQIPALVDAGYRVIAFDHRTFGRSTAKPLDFHAFPDDLLAILETEKVDRFAIVCQSMGGWTGTLTAMRIPERVRALALCGTPGGILTPDVDKAISGLGNKIRGNDGRVALGNLAWHPTFAERKPELAMLYSQIGAFNVNPSFEGPGAVGAGIRDVQISPEMLQGFSVPTLVIAGAHDGLFPLDAMRSVAAAIPSARLEEFPDSGHSTYFEEADKFNLVLLAFLNEHRD